MVYVDNLERVLCHFRPFPYIFDVVDSKGCGEVKEQHLNEKQKDNQSYDCGIHSVDVGSVREDSL